MDEAYEERWRAERIGIEEGAFVTEGVVVLSSARLGLRGLAVADGRQLWCKKTRFSWNHYLAGDVVYVLQKEDKPTLSSWSLSSGAARAKIPLPGHPVGQAGDQLVCAVWKTGGNQLRRVSAVSLSRGGQLLWSTPLNGRYERLTVVDDIVVASSSQEVLLLSSSSGRELWSRSFSARLASWPLRTGPHILAWTYTEVRCFEAVSGRQLWARPMTRYRHVAPTELERPEPIGDLLVWLEGRRQCLFRAASGNVIEWLHVDTNVVHQAGDDLLFGGPFGELRVFRRNRSRSRRLDAAGKPL